MDDRLISLKAAIDAVEGVDWYHQNKNGEMVLGANSDEHQAWYKADDIYHVLDTLPSAQPECEDAVSRFKVLRLIDYSSHDLNDSVDNRYMQNEIKQLPSVTPAQPGWIPVTERLPEYFVPVRTWDGQNQCVEMRIPYVITTEGETIKNDWWCGDYWKDKEESLYDPHDLRDGAALAWMPLPEDYKAD